jgi:hypothetical protein
MNYSYPWSPPYICNIYKNLGIHLLTTTHPIIFIYVYFLEANFDNIQRSLSSMMPA